MVWEFRHLEIYKLFNNVVDNEQRLTYLDFFDFQGRCIIVRFRASHTLLYAVVCTLERRGKFIMCVDMCFKYMSTF